MWSHKGTGFRCGCFLNTVDMTLTNKNEIEHFPKRPLQWTSWVADDCILPTLMYFRVKVSVCMLETHTGVCLKIRDCPSNPWIWLILDRKTTWTPIFRDPNCEISIFFYHLNTAFMFQPLRVKLRCPELWDASARNGGQKGSCLTAVSGESVRRNPTPEMYKIHNFNLWSHSRINYMTTWVNPRIVPEIGILLFGAWKWQMLDLLLDAEIPFFFVWRFFQTKSRPLHFDAFIWERGEMLPSLVFVSFLKLLLTLCSQFHHFCHWFGCPMCILASKGFTFGWCIHESKAMILETGKSQKSLDQCRWRPFKDERWVDPGVFLRIFVVGWERIGKHRKNTCAFGPLLVNWGAHGSS